MTTISKNEEQEHASLNNFQSDHALAYRGSLGKQRHEGREKGWDREQDEGRGGSNRWRMSMEEWWQDEMSWLWQHCRASYENGTAAAHDGDATSAWTANATRGACLDADKVLRFRHKEASDRHLLETTYL